MADYVISIRQGEHLYQEMTLLDSDRTAVDITNATLSIENESAVDDLSISATKGTATDGQFYVTADAANTVGAPLGLFKVQVWATWSSGNPTKEMILEFFLEIKEVAA